MAKRASAQSGSILIFTLWTLALIALFAMAVGVQARQRLRYVQHFEIRDKLRAAAESGISVARQAVFASKRYPAHSLNGLWSNDEKNFREILMNGAFYSVKSRAESDGTTVRYGAVDEARKIDLNKTDSLQVLQRLFQIAAKLPAAEAQDIAGSLLDWRDEDDVLNAGGAETRYYRGLNPPYEAKNAPLDTVEELLLIKGVTPEIFLKVQPYVTVDGENIVNINTASEVVLLAYGFNADLVEKIMTFRRGRDRVEGSADDYVFQNQASIADDLKRVVSMSDAEANSFRDFAQSGLLDVRSNMFSAMSEAGIPRRKEKLTLTCYFHMDGGLRRCHESWGRFEEESERTYEEN